MFVMITETQLAEMVKEAKAATKQKKFKIRDKKFPIIWMLRTCKQGKEIIFKGMVRS